MEDYDHLSDVACSKFATIKRGTLNKKWKLEFDNFQIPLPVDQATFAFAVATIHTRLKIDFILNNVGSHYRTLKAWYDEIKKVKGLSGIGWNDETKMITLNLVLASMYIEVII